MTLIHKPEHNVAHSLIESGVAHVQFRTEAGCQRFIEDNRAAIKSAHIHWNVDYEPVLTFTAAR